MIALRLLDLGEGGVGVLNAALGLGGVVGDLVLCGRARERLSGDLRLGLLLCALPLAALALLPLSTVAFAVLALAGIGNTFVGVTTFTLLQRIAPEEIRARVFGVLEGLGVGAAGVAPSWRRPSSPRAGVAGRSQLWAYSWGFYRLCVEASRRVEPGA